MKHYSLGALVLAFFFFSGIGLAQELPAENPREVWVKGRQVRHSWKDGRIFIDTLDAETLLRVKSEYRQVDLIEALVERGDYVWTVTDGKFEATRDSSKYSVNVDTDRAKRQNAIQASTGGAYRPKKSEEGLGLQYEVQEYNTEWGTRWGKVKVTNIGESTSDSCTAYLHFQDGFGRTYSEDWWPIRSLEPGESQFIDIPALKNVEDLSITPTNDNIAVYFFSNEDASKNPKSMTEARQQARKNKKRGGLKGPTLDFNRNSPTPQDNSGGIKW